jgi:oxygen-independent coproporphyrinogen-3 oxidase
MIATICQEIELRKDELKEQKIETIYFGGGTPSLLEAEQLKAILQSVYLHFPVDSNVEVTLEANPDDMTQENLLLWRGEGINRLSIGLQSFRPDDLRWMNRAHTADEAQKCVGLAQKAGFNQISIDLMYGLPNLDTQTWTDHLDYALSLNIQHISAYCLTVEAQTKLASEIKKGNIVTSTEDEQAEQFKILVATLAANGFEQYEISNFCANESYAKHNTNYWKGIDYLGVGPSAHSFNQTHRRFNVANNRQYMKLLKKGEVYFEKEELSPSNQFNELIMTGLRTKWGVSLERLTRFDLKMEAFSVRLEEFKAKGWILLENDQLLLTSDGRLMADYISAELFVN